MRKLSIVIIAILTLMPLATFAAHQALPTGDGDGSSRETPYAPGVTGEVGDYTLRVVDVIPDATEMVLEESSLNSPPAAGDTLFMVRVDATYTGRDTGTPGRDLRLNVVGDLNRGYSEWQASCGLLIPDGAGFAPELFENGSTEFNACWSIPDEEDTSSLVMYVEASGADERVWFALPHEGAAPEQNAQPTPEPETGETEGDTEPVTIVALDTLAYDQSEVAVYPGQTLALQNDGFLQHDLIVYEWDWQLTPLLNNGETAEFSVPADAEIGDEFEFYCSVPGHKEGGMVGTFTIVAQGDETQPDAEDDDAGDRPDIERDLGEVPADATTIIALDTLAFDPALMQVYPGQTIALQNDGFLQHDLAVDAWGGQLVPPLNNGEAAAFTVPDDAAVGEEFDFYCTIPGHKEGGMHGTFVIVEREDVAAQPVEPAEPAVETDVATSGEPVAVVALDTLEFEPADVEVFPGQTVIVTNEGFLQHDLAVDEWGGFLTPLLNYGDSAEFTVPDDAPVGETLEFYCSVPGHVEGGQAGTFTIVEPPAMDQAEAAVDVRDVHVSATEWAFEPANFSIAAGGTIVLTNEGTVAHGMAADAFGGTFIEPVAAGETTEFSIPANLEPGEVIEYTAVNASAAQLGMGGTITIVAAGDVVDATLAATPAPASMASPEAGAFATPASSPMTTPVASPVLTGGAEDFFAGATVIMGDDVERYIWDDTASEIPGTGLTPVSLTVGNHNGGVWLFAEFINTSPDPIVTPLMEFEATYNGVGFGTQYAHSFQYEVMPGDAVYYDGLNLYGGSILYGDWTGITIGFRESITQGEEYVASGLRIEQSEGRIYNDGPNDMENASIQGVGLDAEGVYSGSCGHASIRATVPTGLFVRLPEDVAATPAAHECWGTAGVEFAERLGTGPVTRVGWIPYVPKP